jgi:flagellar basal-body rod protein FlgB
MRAQPTVFRRRQAADACATHGEVAADVVRTSSSAACETFCAAWHSCCYDGSSTAAEIAMSPSTEGLFGNHVQALALWQRRAEVLAANLANADTPNYQARDIDFRSALGGASADAAPLALAAPSSGTAASMSLEGADALKYRVPMQPSLDGNTVDAESEQAAFAENSVRYQASLTFITAQIRTLRTAITGT